MVIDPVNEIGRLAFCSRAPCNEYRSSDETRASNPLRNAPVDKTLVYPSPAISMEIQLFLEWNENFIVSSLIFLVRFLKVFREKEKKGEEFR